jgi:ABC-2 type transport system ATP-binding protein
MAKEESVHMVLTVEKASKAYSGGKRVLHDVSLEIPKGRFIGLLGPSGCGKTTLVKIILGLVKQDSGRILLDSKPLTLRRVREELGYVPQNDSFYDYMTVRENYDYFKSLAAMSPQSTRDADDDQQNGTELLSPKDVGLHEDAIAGTLSGGQRKRLSILCTLVKRPRLLFLDEPTTGLDPLTKRDLLALIKGLVDKDTSVVLVTHVMNEAQELCDDVILLSNARLLAYDSPKALIRRTGSSNLEEAFIKLVMREKHARSEVKK